MGDLDRLGDLLPPEASGRAGTAPGRAAGSLGAPGGAAAPGDGPDDDLARRVAGVWAEEVGPEIALNARPVQLRNGRLVVTTSSSSWAQTLQLMSPMVVERLNRRLGEGSVEKAVFRHAGWDPTWAAAPGFAGASAATTPASAAPMATPTPAVAPKTAPPAASATSKPDDLSPEEEKALAEVEGLPLPPEVRRTIRQAMIAGFVRGRQDSGRS